MKEEKNREVVIENLEDDFSDIKEMQKTQELRKIEEEKIQEDKRDEVKGKKNHPMFVSILVILLLCAFACMGFFGGIYYYKNSINKETVDDTSKNDKNEKEIENDFTNHQDKEESSVELSDQQKEEIKKNVYDLGLYFADYYEKGISSISNQDLLYFALKTIGFKETISKDEIESIIYKYFGDNLKVSHEAIKCSISNHEPLYYYEEEMYKMNENHGGHGGGKGGYTSYPGFVSGEMKGNTITVKYKIAYYNSCGDVCPSYQLYDAPTNQKNPLYESVNSNGGIVPFSCDEKIFDTIKDKLPVTTFIFDNEYHLKQVSVQK